MASWSSARICVLVFAALLAGGLVEATSAAMRNLTCTMISCTSIPSASKAKCTNDCAWNATTSACEPSSGLTAKLVVQALTDLGAPSIYLATEVMGSMAEACAGNAQSACAGNCSWTGSTCKVTTAALTTYLPSKYHSAVTAWQECEGKLDKTACQASSGCMWAKDGSQFSCGPTYDTMYVLLDCPASAVVNTTSRFGDGPTTFPASAVVSSASRFGDGPTTLKNLAPVMWLALAFQFLSA